MHSRNLLGQWCEQIEKFLAVSQTEIGVIGGGKFRVGERITVALVNSLYKRVDEVIPYIGTLLVDECHRCPSRTMTDAASAFDSRYTIGLSATPYRRDGLTKLIYWYLGDRRYQVDRTVFEQNGSILRARVVVRETEFRTRTDASTHYSRVISQLTKNSARNRLIAADVAKVIKTGNGTPLVLTERKKHALALQKALAEYDVNTSILTGDTPSKQRQEIVTQLGKGQVGVLIATGPLLGEGFDAPGLSTLFLATPVKFSGRLLRISAGSSGRSRIKKERCLWTMLMSISVFCEHRQKRAGACMIE